MRPIDVAIAVIVKQSTVLICQRKDDDSFGGFWEFPGGKREKDESLHQCIVREIREELDLIVRPIGTFPGVRHDYPHVCLTLHPFVCEIVSGELKLIACQRAQWVDAAELTTFRFPPASASIVLRVAELLSRGSC